MTDPYEPASDFLKAVAASEAPLSGSPFGDANLALLIAMTSDPDRSNRDWATFLLAHCDIDRQPVRQALLRAARDEDDDVRVEAIFGLALRDREAALPFVKQALSQESAAAPIFDAAAMLAHPSLIDDLRRFAAGSSDGASIDDLVIEALAACESGASPK